ncbi:MAG TPA: shikimate kinase [Thermoanaerobaculia bacterium]|nr:shikimate kinase [Thermoanaerobaculia bacterium]
MKIYLVGFMGAGKSSVGLELAKRLDVPFFDLDELIEAAEGKKIKDLFATQGEPYFRKRERDMLKSTRHLEHAVIATGGGTFTFEDNIQFILGEGYSIHLSAPFALLRNRIGDKATERPMFRDDVATHELYQHRLKFYRMSDATLETRDDETISEVVERLIMLLPKEILGAIPRRDWRAR